MDNILFDLSSIKLNLQEVYDKLNREQKEYTTLHFCIDNDVNKELFHLKIKKDEIRDFINSFNKDNLIKSNIKLTVEDLTL